MKTMIEPNTIHHGDCFDFLPEVEAGSIDMILCDLPYGTTQNKWDSALPLDKLFAEYWRVLKPNGCICLFAQQPFLTALINASPKEFRYEWVWEKNNVTGFLNAKRMPLKAHENLAIFYRKLPTYNPQMVAGERRKIGRGSHKNFHTYSKFEDLPMKFSNLYYPKDVIKFKSSTTRSHPTEKPVGLCEYMIKTYTNPGEVILDNAAGSGTTAVACIRTGRKYICMEKDDRYFEVMKRRIENENLRNE